MSSDKRFVGISSRC